MMNFLNFSRQSGLGVFICSLSIKFPSFLSALASNNQLIIKLVKMWSGGTPHVVVGTLKISSDRLKLHPKWKEKNDSK